MDKKQFSDFLRAHTTPASAEELISQFDSFGGKQKGFINESELKAAFCTYSIFTKKEDEEYWARLLSAKSGSTGESTHKIDVKVGDTSNIKTKIELKCFVQGSGEKKHWSHISKCLHFSEESIGGIIRIHSNSPRDSAERISKLIEEAKELATALLPPDSIPKNLLDNVDIEVSNDEEVVSIGIKLKDESENLKTLMVLSGFDKLLEHLNTDIHAAIEFKHDFHSLFGEKKSLPTLFTDGGLIFSHIKTQSTNFFQTLFKIIAEEEPSLAPLSTLAALYFQKNFDLQLSAENFDFSGIVGSIIGQNLDIKDTTFFHTDPDVKAMLQEVNRLMQNPPVPLLEEVVELTKKHLRANFSISIKLSDFIITFHAKTSGIKELIESGSSKQTV